MSRLPGRVIGTLVSVSAIALVASGTLLDWSGSAAATLPDRPDESRRLELGRAKTVLVCPGAPELPEAGDTDQDFEGDQAETQSEVVATAPLGQARLVGAVVSAPGPDGVTPPPEQLAVTEGEETQSLRSDSGESVTVVAVPSALRAAGLSALRTSLTGDGDLRGLAASSCVAPASRSYVVGGGVEPGRSNLLMLANPGRTTAVVNLRVLTATGAVEPASAQDLAVAPGTVRELRLEALVPAQPVVAVEVVAHGGQVAAAMTDTQLQGVVPAGVEVLPATAATTSAVIPGVVARGAKVTLRIAVPGTEPAVVGWRVEGPDGPVTPTGEAVVSVQPGEVADVPLEGLGRRPVNLLVESDQEVAVSAEVVLSPAPDPTGSAEGDDLATERAYAVPAAAITDTALLSVAGDRLLTNLVLSSADTEAVVSVSPVDDDGKVGDPVDVPVEAGAVAMVPQEGFEGAQALLVQVRSGEVHIAQILGAVVDPDVQNRSPLFSIVPVTVPPSTQTTVHVGSAPPGRWP